MALLDQRQFAPGCPRAYLVLGCVGLLMLPCCRGGSQGDRTPTGGSQAPSRPNIILLTVDTLRADHMALYGYVRDTMPAIEAFAETAIVFDNAVVPRGITRPSYASMLTGLYPFHHGVRLNNAVLHENLTTLPEILKDAGYHTAGFVGNFVIAGDFSGLNQGFDLYDDKFQDDKTNPAGYERKADKLLEAILRWLNDDPPQPFLLFTNFMDPHGPYNPPERFRSMYRSTKFRLVDPESMPDYQRKEGQLNFYDYVDRYDAEIRFTDEALGILIAELKRKDLWDDALVIFVADHGECMGQHTFYFEHEHHLWDETMHVPMAIRLPRTQIARREAAAKRIDSTPRRLSGLCSPMDLTPSILDYLGVSTDMDFDGRSLLPMMRGNADDERMLLLECPSLSMPRHDPPLDDLYAARTHTHKLMQLFDYKTGKLKQQAVFDLVADPLERNDIRVDAQDPVHRRLSDGLATMLRDVRHYKLPFPLTVYDVKLGDFLEQQAGAGKTVHKTLTTDQAERLRSLGYMQ